MTNRLTGLIAAAHTPFQADGAVNLGVVEKQAEHLLGNGIETVFICGSTGESHSLSVNERLRLAERWSEVADGTPMSVVVHVGSNCLVDARELAAHAGKRRVLGISALAPSYFRPRNVSALVEWCAGIAECAPETPFYFYDIPAWTKVDFSMPRFLEMASDRIPTLRGIKFSNNDLTAFQVCLRLDGGTLDVAWGMDDCLLAGLALGARCAVGSTYNFAAPVFHRLRTAFDAGDLATAGEEQFRVVELIRLLSRYGYLGAAKMVMQMLGVDVGPARLPNGNPTAEEIKTLRCQLEELGYFDWSCAKQRKVLS
jgi:N-acetylneuraminate lyase